MTIQLSDCCKATIDFYPKLERPDCYRCSFCDRVIGSPMTQPTKSNEEIVALALTPLIKQIFHGENYTSEAIHKEMDKTIKLLADTITAKDAQRVKAVEDMKSKRNAVVKEYEDEGIMFILKVEDGKTYEASMPIPKWAEVGKLEFRTLPPEEVLVQKTQKMNTL